MVKRVFVLLLLLGSWYCAWSQPAVRIGDDRFVPVRNVESSGTRGGGVEDIGVAVGGWHNVLVQLGEGSMSAGVDLSGFGVELTDYLGGGAYYALLREGVRLVDLRGSGVVSVMGVRPSWKVSGGLLEGDVPDYARVGSGVRVELRFADNAGAGVVEGALAVLGSSDVFVSEALGYATAVVPEESLAGLAGYSWVKALHAGGVPQRVDNRRARMVTRAHGVKLPGRLGGRGLDGSGVNIGVWDGNAFGHVDYTGRVTQVESEVGAHVDHGTHVTGTILGAGLVDEDRAGMAPGARAWTHNFGANRNGKTEPLEMLEALMDHGVTLTSHSYGVPLECGDSYEKEQFCYGMTDQLHDLLAEKYNQTHVFSAGNFQTYCRDDANARYRAEGYGTVTRRTKNAILVGAVDDQDGMTYFSSWGPQDDGRLAPTVATLGHQVMSTSPWGYQPMDGTSMSAPVTTGSIALLMQRWRQLHGGKGMRSALVRAVVANTARDAGLPGPDFKFGFGLLDIEHAIRSVEKGQYYQGEVTASMASREYTGKIVVPEGVTRVKVLLTWNDPSPEKVYAWGERALTNDLDLEVDGVKALFADPKRVQDAARPVGDTLNNIEQVVIDNPPAGELEYLVIGRRIVSGDEQAFAISWCFEYAGGRRVLYPVGGEVFEPGEEVPVQLRGMREMMSCELSYDGGASFVEMSAPPFDFYNPSASDRFTVTIPADAPATRSGVLRFIGGMTGSVVVNEVPFTISPRVQNLRVESGDFCGGKARLAWDAVEGVVEGGYVVLRAPLGGSTFEEVKRVGPDVLASDVEFAEGGWVYSVAVGIGDGWGKRALGVSVNRPVAHRVRSVELPFVESFSNSYAGRFTLSPANGVRAYFGPDGASDASLPSGSHAAVFESAAAVGGDYDPSAPFAEAGRVSYLRSCSFGLDGEGFPDSLQVTVMARLRAVDPSRPPVLRIVAGGEALKGLDGRVYVSGNGLIVSSFPVRREALNGGPLDVELVLPSPGDRVSVLAVVIEEIPRIADVVLSLSSLPASGRELGVSRVVGRVRNLSGLPLESIPVEVYLNGRACGSTVLDRLEGLSEKEVAVDVDFSSSDPFGAVYEVKMVVALSGDPTPGNNVVGGRVVNYGRSVPMGLMHQQIFLGRYFDIASRDIYRLSVGERVHFVDAGGAYGAYPLQKHFSWYKFKPSDPSRVVRARIIQLGLDSVGGQLTVYQGSVPDAMEGRMEGVVREELVHGADIPLPREYVSLAEDGALTFLFKGDKPGSATGWQIVIDEVVRENRLSIKPDISVHMEGKPMGPFGMGFVPLSVVVKNFSGVEVKDATVFFKVGVNGDDKKLDPLAPGETTVSLPPLIVDSRSVSDVEVKLRSSLDPDASDNVARGVAIFDSYPIPPRSVDVPEAGIDLGGVRSRGDALHFDSREVRSARPGYLFEAYYHKANSSLRVYRDQKTKQVALVGLRLKDGYSVALHVDWDGDKVFTACGAYTGTGSEVAAVDEQVYLSLNGLDGTVSAGKKRARIVLGRTGSVDDPVFKDASKRAGSFVYDFFIDVVEGGPAHEVSLALTDACIGTKDEAFWGKGVMVDAEQFSAGLYVYFKMINVGSESFAGGNVKMKLSPKYEHLGQAYDGEITAGVLKPHGVDTVECKMKFEGYDLSSKGGRRVIDVDIVNPAPEREQGWKEVTYQMRLVKSGERGLTALEFSHATRGEAKESLVLPRVASADPLFVANRGATFEFWICPSEVGNWMPFFGLDQLEVYVTGGNAFMGEPVAANALAVVLGDAFVAWTKESVFRPGRWTHVALAFGEVDVTAGKTGRFSIYIDGKRLDDAAVVRHRDGGSLSFNELQVGSQFKGKVDEIRLWGVERTGEQIAQNRDKWLDASSDGLDKLIYSFNLSEGSGNRLLRGHPVKGVGEVSATIRPVLTHEDADREMNFDGGLWFNQGSEGQLLGVRMDAAERVEYEAKASSVKVTLKAGADLSSLSGVVESVWPGSVVRIADDAAGLSGAAPLNGDGLSFRFEGLDFSGSAEKHLRVEKTLYGESLRTDVTLRVIVGSAAPKAVALTSLKVGNKEVSPVTATMELLVDESFLAPQVVTFTVTGGGALRGGYADLKSGESKIDLSRVQTLTLVGGGGKTVGHYVLRARVRQRIEGKGVGDTLRLPYSDTVVTLDFKSSAGLPLEYTSSDARVAVAHDGRLHLTGPGKATITVGQPGNEKYAAAEPVRFTVEVKRGVVQVIPRIAPLPYGTPLTWHYRYDDEALVNGLDGFDLPDPGSWAGWEIVDGNGRIWNGKGLLPIGHYALRPRVKRYEGARLYVVEALPGRLAVVANEKIVQGLIRVVGDDGVTGVAGARVMLNGKLLLADGAGEVLVGMIQKRYDAEVWFPGYVTWYGELTVREDTLTQEFLVVLSRGAYGLSYGVEGEGGTIGGAAEQRVEAFGRGRGVRAVADQGYRFAGWSDGVKEAARQEVDVRADLRVLAKFDLKEYVLRYESELPDAFAAGSKVEQKVKYGADAEVVSVKEEIGDSYFYAWDDGLELANRVDKGVRRDGTYRALYARWGELGVKEWFAESETLPNGWYARKNSFMDDRIRWKVVRGNQEIRALPYARRSRLFGHFIAINGDASGSGGRVELVSPRYRLDGLSGDEIELLYNYYFGSHDAHVGIGYRFDGDADFRPVPGIEHADNAFSVQVRTGLSVPSGKKWVQFCFEFRARSGRAGGFGFDNFLVREKSSAPVSLPIAVTLKSDPAGACSFMQCDPVLSWTGVLQGYRDVRPLGGVLEVKRFGGETPYVKIVAGPGNRFVGWYVGDRLVSRDEVLGPQSVIAPVTCTARFEPVGTTFVRYDVTPAGAGAVMRAGTDVTGQVERVAAGGTLPDVEAVAKSGYRFVRWSSGDSDAKLQGYQPREDGFIMAIFEAEQVVVLRDLKLTVKREVVGADGKQTDEAVKGVTLLVVDEDGAVCASGVTGANGEAVVKVAEGSYTVRACLDGYDALSKSVTVGASGGSLELRYVEEDPLRDVEFVVRDVRGVGIEGALVVIGGVTDTLVCDVSGAVRRRFEMGKRLVVKALAKGYAEGNGVAYTVRGDGADRVEVILRKEVQVRIVVKTEQDGGPLAGAKVWVRERFVGESDGDGAVELLLPEGRIGVRVDHVGYEPLIGYVVDAVPGAAVQEVVVSLREVRYPMVFFVYDALSSDQRPLAGATVTVLPQGVRLTTGEDGRVTYDLGMGVHAVSVHCDGYDYLGKISFEVEDRGYEFSVGLRPLKGDDGAATPVAQVELERVVLSPNPFVGSLRLSNVEGVEVVEVYSVLGELLRRVELHGEGELSLELGDLVSGVYVVRLVGAGDVRSQLVVKGQ